MQKTWPKILVVLLFGLLIAAAAYIGLPIAAVATC